ncbi:TPA: hypothetical protein ACGUO9_004407 [Vibrio vulnificus]|nr:hypothetical protein [Vibrio vulnificus]HDY7776769.1 hypothetical protein [Vibrio vulnificus]
MATKKKMKADSVLFFVLSASSFVANIYVSVFDIDVGRVNSSTLSVAWMVFLLFGFLSVFSKRNASKQSGTSSIGVDSGLELTGPNSIDPVTRAASGDPVAMSLYNLD